MAIAWPWRRPQPAPTTPPPASVSDPRWRGLPPVQRTVNEITPTAPLDDFSSSLTTAQDPGLVSPVSPLVTGDGASMPILAADLPAVPSAPSEPVVPQPRRWQPSLNLPQRILPAPATVQRNVDGPRRVDSGAHPLVVVPVTETAALTHAPAPDERREVAAFVEPTAAQPTPVEEHDPAPADTNISSAPSDDIQVVPNSSVQRSTSAAPPTELASPPRLHSVQRAEEPATDPPTIAVGARRAALPERVVAQRVTPIEATTTPYPEAATASATPIESSPVPERPEHAVVESAVAEETAPPSAVDEHSAAPMPHIQRSTPVDTIAWFGPDDPVTIPPSAPASTGTQSAPRPRPSPAPPLQRITEQPSSPPPRSLAGEAPSAEPKSIVAEQMSDDLPPLQRVVPVSAQSTPVAAFAGVTERIDPRISARQVQRTQTSSSLPMLETRPPAPPHPVQRTREAFDADARTPAAPGRLETVHELPAEHLEPATSDTTNPGIPLATRSLAASPALQRLPEPASPATARVVVLPPIGGAPALGQSASVAPHEPTTIAESPRPMSLQRMFEHTATRIPHHEPALTTPPSQPGGSATVSENSGYTEITFPQHAVQRDAESSENDSSGTPSTPTETASATETSSATVTAAQPPTAAASENPGGTNIDELVNRLYDPLAARLRAELWLDRERAGVLMDLRR